MSEAVVTFSLPDLAAMEAFGARIAQRLRVGDVVALEGTLGAGKTTLARAIIAALGHRGEVPSPTFTIIETYPDTQPPLVHADFYRLGDPSEVDELGLDDYRQGAVLLAEWPDHAGGFAREASCLTITLAIDDPENGDKQNGDPENGDRGRKAIARGGADWLGRMP